MKTINQEEAIHQTLARSCLYHHLSPLFLYPEEKTFSDLNWEEAGEAVSLLGNPDGLKEAFEALRDCCCLKKGLADLQSEYIRVFSHALSDECPPYETQYGWSPAGDSGALFRQSQELADISGFYRAFGLDLSDQIKERLDHIAIELEFMAFLSYKEAYALSTEGEEKVGICREAQRKFLNDHLGQWAPTFVTHLKKKVEDGFYFKLAGLMERFLELEVKGLEIEPPKIELNLIKPEAGGDCFSCGEKNICFPGEVSEGEEASS